MRARDPSLPTFFVRSPYNRPRDSPPPLFLPFVDPRRGAETSRTTSPDVYRLLTHFISPSFPCSPLPPSFSLCFSPFPLPPEKNNPTCVARERRCKISLNACFIFAPEKMPFCASDAYFEKKKKKKKKNSLRSTGRIGSPRILGSGASEPLKNAIWRGKFSQCVQRSGSIVARYIRVYITRQVSYDIADTERGGGEGRERRGIKTRKSRRDGIPSPRFNPPRS